MSSREIVITGLGIASPIGVGREQTWASVAQQRSGVRPLPHLASTAWPAPFGGEVIDFEPKELIQPRKSIKVMCRETQLASAAAEMAWQDASLSQEKVDPERFGVIGAASMMYCDLEELRVPFLEWLKKQDFDIRRWSREAMGELFPLWMLKYLPNMPACHVGIRYDARGPNNTIAAADVSPLLALAEATDVIRRGHADVMIVGGTGSRLNVNDFLWRGGERVARSNGRPEAACRPFDAERSGLVYGEGAAQVVLEAREHAERRGAKPIARIVATATRCELSADEKRPSGDGLRRTLRAVLNSAQMRPEEIAYVNAHGNSTLEDDAMEAHAIRDVLGDVPVTAPKSFFGNLGAGSGMVELVVSLLALEQGKIPPTLNYETPDPECPVNVVTEVRPAKGGTFVKVNHNTMGQAAAVIFKGEKGR